MKKKRIRKGQVITMKEMIKGMVFVALALVVVLGLESRVDAAGRTVRISKKNFPSKAVRVELKQRWDDRVDQALQVRKELSDDRVDQALQMGKGM